VGVLVAIEMPGGALMTRTERNCSTHPCRKDARWTLSGPKPKRGKTINLKL
jgi:hypothetical protein